MLDFETLLLIILGFLSVFIPIIVYLLEESKVSVSKTNQFDKEIKPNEVCTLFDFKGKGTFTRIEMVATGYSDVFIRITTDESVVIDEGVYGLYGKGSSYIREFLAPFAGSIGKYSLEMDLHKNFHKNVGVSIANKDRSRVLTVKGTIHYETSKFVLPKLVHGK